MAMTGPIHVLLVEDNQADVYLMKYFFETLGFSGTLDHVGDGLQALDYLNETRVPDLVLLDLGLPKLNGHEVLERVRKNPKLQGLPILVLSTSKTDSDSVRSLNLGANGFITKPSDLNEIESMVRKLIQEEIPKFLSQTASA